MRRVARCQTRGICYDQTYELATGRVAYLKVHKDGSSCYGTTLGRFDTRDVLFGDPAFPTSLNTSVYAQDDPVTYSDPTGLCPIPWECPSATGFGGFHSPGWVATGQAHTSAEESRNLYVPAPQSIWGAPVTWSLSGAPVNLAGAQRTWADWYKAFMDLISSLPGKGGGVLAGGMPSYEQTLQALTVAQPETFPARTRATLEFRGRQWGYIVTAHTVYDIGTADVSVIGVLYTVRTASGKTYQFSGLAKSDPREFLLPGPGKYLRSTLGSQVVPYSAGPPIALDTSVLEMYPDAVGEGLEYVLVDSQRFYLPPPPW
jgi:hypothetical protein